MFCIVLRLAMPDLASFQAAFAAQVRDHVPRHGDPTGLRVYRNTAAKGAADALRDNYPAVARLFGVALFDNAAATFIRHFPPRSPVLADYGAGFADFLAQSELPEGCDHAVGLARIDRMTTEAHIAADSGVVEPRDLVGRDALQWDRIRLALHPACRFAWFDPAVPQLWCDLRNAVEDNGLLMTTPASVAGEAIVLTRPFGQIQHRVAAREDHLFLAATAQGQSVAAAAAEVITEVPEANLAMLFARLIDDGAFASIEPLRSASCPL